MLIFGPDVLLLELIGYVVLLAEGQSCQKHPFSDGGTMDATARRYINVRVRNYGILDNLLNASGEEVDEFETSDIFQ